MLVLPKVPHHLRTLTSSVSRLINPASSSGGSAAAAGPSVTFTSSSAAGVGNPIIGGGGPFTSNSFLVGGGALTKTGPGAAESGQLAFGSWAPYSGTGGGAGAGRSKAGAGHYGYTGHARAFISSAPTASDVSNTLFEEDDQDLQSALALHRSRLRTPSVSSDASAAHVRLKTDGLKVIRPSTTRRIADAQSGEPAKMRSLMRERAKRYTSASAAAAGAQGSLEEALSEQSEGQVLLDSRPSRRPRGRSTTSYSLPFHRGSHSLLASTSAAATDPAQARALSSTPPASIDVQTQSNEQDDVLILPEDFDASVNTLAPSAASPAPSAAPSTSAVSDTFASEPLPSEASSLAFPPVSSLPRPPSPASKPEDQSLRPLVSPLPLPPKPSVAPEALVKKASPSSPALGLDIGPPPGLTLQRGLPLGATPEEAARPEPTLPHSVPEDYVDPVEEAHLDSLREAHYAGSIPLLLDAARTYVAQPGLPQLAPGQPSLPLQTIEALNATFKMLAAARPSGAPIDEIMTAWSTMIRKGVPPNVETYAVMIRVLCERQLEVAETSEYVALNGKPRSAQPSRKGEEEQRVSLITPPPTYRFLSQVPIDDILKEDVFTRAFTLFKSVTTFPALKTSWLPVDVYDALLAASSTSRKPVFCALAVFSHLKHAVESQREASGLLFTPDTFTGLITTYDRVGQMQDAETAFDGFRAAEAAGQVAVAADVPVDVARITPWNAMISGYFRNSDPAAAIALVESLIQPTSSEGTVPPPAIQPSTFTAVIKGFLANDDLPSALQWFDRVAVSDTALPPMEPATYLLLLEHASKNKDLATYDHVFDRFTAHMSADYHLRPLEVAEAINLHLDAAREAEGNPEKANSHLDRIFEFVARCDQLEQSRYLYPAVIADPLLRLLVQYTRVEELQDVYLRAIRSGQEMVEDPLAAVKFHAFFFESIVYWLTTPGAKPLDYSVSDRLRLVGLLADLARTAGIPTDLTGEQIAARILHLHDQARLESEGALALDDNLIALVSEAETVERRRLGIPDPVEQPSTVQSNNAASTAAAEVASQTETDFATTASSATTETPLSSLNDELIAPPSSIDDFAVLAEEASASSPVPAQPPRFVLDVNLARSMEPSGNSKTWAVDAYNVLKRSLVKGAVAPPRALASLLGGLGREHQPELAAEVLELAHQVLLTLPPPTPEDQLGAWLKIENHAIIAFSHCGLMDRANFHRMNIINANAAPSSDAYSALINAAKDTTDDAAVARLLFQEAVNLGVEPNLFLYNTVISSLSKARKSEEAMALFYEMEKKGLQPSTVTYGTVVNALCRTGDTENAIKFFNAMCAQPKFKARVPPFNTMMQYFTQTQPDRARVLHYYDRLVEYKVQPSSHTYNILMQAFGMIEPLDLRAMHKVFDTLKRNPHADAKVEGQHWATLISCHGGAANKDLDTALQVFNSIADHNAPNTPFGQSDLPDAVCWEAIFDVILRHRRFDLLAEYIERLNASGLQPTTYIQNVLIRALAVEGNMEKARIVFEGMSDPPMGIAAPHAYARKGRTGRAPVGVVHREPSTYETMVRAELAAGEHERALRLCERMEERLYPVSVTAKIRGILGEDV